MGLFSRKKKFIDLTGGYRGEQEEFEEEKEGGNSQNNLEKDYPAGSPEDKKRRLMKRLINMSEKLEEMSTQIYHLQQRIEVLEKKTGVGREE